MIVNANRNGKHSAAAIFLRQHYKMAKKCCIVVRSSVIIFLNLYSISSGSYIGNKEQSKPAENTCIKATFEPFAVALRE